ncbi:MAG: cupin domain-containing protein [Candidatus Kapaibacterium sp.]
MKIIVEKLGQKQLDSLNVNSWPVWTKEVSEFDWHYDETEQCYLLDGRVTVKTADGETNFGKGDFVTFPKGLSCIWKVHEPVRKHYKFG